MTVEYELTDEQVQRFRNYAEKLVEHYGTMSEVAERAGYNIGTLSHAMNGTRRPGRQVFYATYDLYDDTFPATTGGGSVEHGVENDFPSKQKRHNRGDVGVLGKISRANEELSEMLSHLEEARKHYDNFAKEMGLAYIDAPGLVAKGIDATMDELRETKKFLEDTTNGV